MMKERSLPYHSYNLMNTTHCVLTKLDQTYMVFLSMPDKQTPRLDPFLQEYLPLDSSTNQCNTKQACISQMVQHEADLNSKEVMQCLIIALLPAGIRAMEFSIRNYGHSKRKFHCYYNLP